MLVQTAPKKLASQALPELLKNIRDKGAKSIVLTDGGVRSLGMPEKQVVLEQWMAGTLALQGLDFSNSFPGVGRLELGPLSSSDSNATFSKGVLFSDGKANPHSRYKK